MKISDCCGAASEYADDIDICPECREHCDFEEEDDEEHFLEFDSLEG
jgi:hypothetical protein